jgi:glycosyltransferase involved in cell wall biosynthesis
MKTTIFMPCYNEEAIIPHAIEHYRSRLKSCEFVIYDNYSTDNSRDLAESLGCKVLFWNTEDKIDDIRLRELKNNCWKHVEEGWIIVCDVDEWLCIDDDSLALEEDEGNTILETFGVDMVGNSKSTYLNDINPHAVCKGIKNKHMSKNICFRSGSLGDINYECGAHLCSPVGNVRWGGPYLLKHMSWLGLPYKIRRNRTNYKRSHDMRRIGLAIHYVEHDEKIKSKYNQNLSIASDISKFCDCFHKEETKSKT